MGLAGCGRIGFDGNRIPAITLTVDNSYVVALANSGQIIATVAAVNNLTAPDIAACPIGRGPERYSLEDYPPFDEVLIWAFDDGPNARGVIGELDTGDGTIPISADDPACADGSLATDPRSDLVTMLGKCNAGTASASGGWVPGNGVGMLATSQWDNGYAYCNVFSPRTHWLWWTDGTKDPLLTDDGSRMLLIRVPVH